MNWRLRAKTLVEATSSASRRCGVSYALELQADVQQRFRVLPVDVQEVVLDLLDELAAAASPTTLTIKRSTDEHMLNYEDETSSFRLFLTIESDHATRRSIVLRLW